jgi:hypothetical protein
MTRNLQAKEDFDSTPEWRHACRNDTTIAPVIRGVAHEGCVVAGAFDN